MALEEQPTPTPDDSDDITQNDDGSVDVGEMSEKESNKESMAQKKHDANLADSLDENHRRNLGMKLKDYLGVDEESRRDHLRRLRKGLEIIGLSDIPSDETVFEGASTVTHPALAEAMVQFQSRSISEVFPPQGPVKVVPEDDVDEDQEDQADRIEVFMNRQLTKLDKQYFWNVDQMLFYLPFAGSAFKKCFYDIQLGMPVARFLRVEDFIVPYDAMSLEDASRYTHRYYMTGNDLKRAIADGEFIEPKGIWRQPYVAESSPEDPRMLLDHADARNVVRHEDDSTYEMCEMHIDFQFTNESVPLCPKDTITPWARVPSGFYDATGQKKNEFAYPYIITFERETGEVLAIRRNWKIDDDKRRKRVWFVHYKYLPGFGFYGFGLLHLIGSLGAAAGGALRLLLDGSLTSSLQGGFRTKSLSQAGEVRYKAGEWVDVDASAEDLAKGFYTPPFKEPTPALFSTLKLLVEGIQSFSSTTEAMTGESPNTGPVGTTLAIIEQGSKVFSAIHKRLHTSAGEEFGILYTLNSEYMADEKYPINSKQFNGIKIGQDFNGTITHEIRPVSDPNIWSSTMRIAQAQSVLGLITSDPSLYSEKAKRKAHREMLRALRVHDVDQYMSTDAYSELDPVSENMAIMANTPVRAFYDQLHTAHIAIHQDFMQKTMPALDPALQQQFQMIMAAHVAEHLAFQYKVEIEKTMGIPLPPFDMHDPTETKVSPDLQNMIASAVAVKVNAVPAPAPNPAAQQQQQQQPTSQQQDAAKAQAIKTQTDAKVQQATKVSQADEARKQLSAMGDAKRKDTETKAKIRREDALLRAKLLREGHIRNAHDIQLPSDNMKFDGGTPKGGQQPPQSPPGQSMAPTPQGPPPSPMGGSGPPIGGSPAGV
jgi:hypothetical protein